MRNITIVRRKYGLGGGCTLDVYAEERGTYDAVIDGVPCRYVGKLTDGGSLTFSIGENRTRIFVIQFLFSSFMHSEMTVISAGSTDLTLTGKWSAMITIATFFRFDQNDSEEARAYHKKLIRNNRLFILAVVGLIFSGCVVALCRFFANR